ncbi:hypothetical protein [Cystobacter fuscus]|uniref:hypothetical protein n=1 Tax=Cystobacter fuscus TaxID=43 RepID=UPI0037BF5C17
MHSNSRANAHWRRRSKRALLESGPGLDGSGQVGGSRWTKSSTAFTKQVRAKR